MFVDEKDREWARAVLEKVETKLDSVLPRARGVIPYRTETGRFENMAEKDIRWWTNGFWEGMLWMLYHHTGQEKSNLTEILHFAEFPAS